MVSVIEPNTDSSHTPTYESVCPFVVVFMIRAPTSLRSRSGPLLPLESTEEGPAKASMGLSGCGWG